VVSPDHHPPPVVASASINIKLCIGEGALLGLSLLVASPNRLDLAKLLIEGITLYSTSLTWDPWSFFLLEGQYTPAVQLLHPLLRQPYYWPPISHLRIPHWNGLGNFWGSHCKLPLSFTIVSLSDPRETAWFFLQESQDRYSLSLGAAALELRGRWASGLSRDDGLCLRFQGLDMGHHHPHLDCCHCNCHFSMGFGKHLPLSHWRKKIENLD
jgi:hypothetical protein